MLSATLPPIISPEPRPSRREVAEVARSSDSARRARSDSAGGGGRHRHLACQRPGQDQWKPSTSWISVTPWARSHTTGSTRTLSMCTSKCRCGPVDSPSEPTRAISCPAAT